MSARDRAIVAARARRAAELAPLRAEVARAIDRVGWRRARPVVAQVLGVRPNGLRGGWWAKVGKRSGARLLVALSLVEPEPRQLTLSHLVPTVAEGR